MSKVGRVYATKNACVQRVMRSFKVKQLVRYCETILLEERCSVGDEGREPLQSKINKVTH